MIDDYQVTVDNVEVTTDRNYNVMIDNDMYVTVDMNVTEAMWRCMMEQKSCER